MTTTREEWLAGGSRVQVPGTPHFLGYGDSDKPQPYDYTLREQADLVEAIWNRAGITTTALVAHDSRIGPLVARLFNESRFAAAIREILGRPVSDETMHDMWLSMSARDGARTSPRMLRYIDERRESRIREVAPGAEVVVLDEPPAVGHYPQVEAPEVVGPLIAGFVS